MVFVHIIWLEQSWLYILLTPNNYGHSLGLGTVLLSKLWLGLGARCVLNLYMVLYVCFSSSFFFWGGGLYEMFINLNSIHRINEQLHSYKPTLPTHWHTLTAHSICSTKMHVNWKNCWLKDAQEETIQEELSA